MGEAEHEMCCYANNTYLVTGMRWEDGSGVASLYRHAQNHYEPRAEQEGIKFSEAFLDQSVICLCPVISAPVGWDDH